MPAFFLEKTNKIKKTFFPNSKTRILGSTFLAKYLTAYHVPFTGPDVCARVRSEGEESKMVVDTRRIKKLKYQMNEVGIIDVFALIKFYWFKRMLSS